MGSTKLLGWIKGSAAMLVVLNLLDLIFTLLLVVSNVTWELNPLMAIVLTWNPIAFAVVKLILVGLSAWLLAYRTGMKYPISTLSILIGLIGLYGVVCAQHLYALATIMVNMASLLS